MGGAVRTPTTSALAADVANNGGAAAVAAADGSSVLPPGEALPTVSDLSHIVTSWPIIYRGTA